MAFWALQILYFSPLRAQPWWARSGPALCSAKPKEAIAAKNYLNEMIKGEKVSIRRVTEDKYGRTVGELSFNGENLQQLLVKEGHAEIYKKYSKPCEWAS